MTVTCIACAHATLRLQSWESPLANPTMARWTRCMTLPDRIGRYFNPFAARDCPAYQPIPADKLARRQEAMQ